MSTVNLQFNHVADNQNNKEVIFNSTIDSFDGVITNRVVITVDNTNAFIISDNDYVLNSIFIIEPDGGTPPDAQITIVIPRIKRGPFTVRNDTLEEVKVKVEGQVLVDRIVEAGETAHYNSDGNAAQTPQGSVSVDGSTGTPGWAKTQFIEVLSAEFGAAYDASFAIGEDNEEILFLLPANSISVRVVGWVKSFEDDVDLHLNFSLDDGVTIEEIAGTYQTSLTPALDIGADGSNAGSATDSKILLATGMGNSPGKKCSFNIRISNYRDGSQFTDVVCKSAWIDASGAFNRGRGGGLYKIANVANVARLKFSSGIIGAAKFMVLALPDSV